MEKNPSKLDEKDYLELLHGKRNGGKYQASHFVIAQEKKATKAEILRNGRVGLPSNMHEDREKKLVKTKKRKMNFDPKLLRFLR